MEKLENLTKEKTSFGDAAVSGLFNGLVAGAAMAVYLVLAGLLLGHGAGFMSYFATGAVVSPQLGTLAHLGVSGIYGILYALLLRGMRFAKFTTVPGWAMGFAYALLLWLVAVLVVLPGPGALLKSIPAVHFLVAHGVYGLVLGLRQKPSSDKTLL
jgi:hypothetical protein